MHCFALGLDGPFELHAADIGEQQVRSAFIPARTHHQLIARTGRMLFDYSDTTEPRNHMTVHTKTIAYNHRDEEALIQAIKTTPKPPQHQPTAPTKPDARIQTAMRTLQTNPNLSAPTLAAQLHLSPSRFQHLFTANTGTTFRRYRLWTRMTQVAKALTTGANLTRAATEAGFASPNHFSETFHTMFGLTPTTLLTTGTKIVIQSTNNNPT
nr:Transcriptional regulator, AraC family [Kibdelosporangium sp. MJ126-NF4]